MSGFEKRVSAFADERTDGAMRGLISYVLSHEIANEEIAQLATTLARSGQVFQFPPGAPTGDIASTGGPSSLSTLLGPLYLVALGLRVPKVGVPGRPAGGIDVMAQVPGYKVQLADQEVYRCVEECGFVHFLADGRNAPLDALLFAYRRRNAVPDLPPLVIASLLAKKVAAGVRRVGLDIRVVGHGNFGKTWQDARTNAGRMVAVAEMLGLKATCFLTNGAMPYQPYIGRGESLLAIAQIMEGAAEGPLSSHDDCCFAMAIGTSGMDRAKRPATDVLRHCMARNLTAQGSSWDAFMAKTGNVADCPRTPLLASAAGFLHLDLAIIRDVLVNMQRRRAPETGTFADPCGVVLTKAQGEYVEQGEVVATVRVEGPDSASVVKELSGGFLVDRACRAAYIFEEVSNA